MGLRIRDIRTGGIEHKFSLLLPSAMTSLYAAGLPAGVYRVYFYLLSAVFVTFISLQRSLQSPSLQPVATYH